jgi:amino-acid N-acetyltransferase
MTQTIRKAQFEDAEAIQNLILLYSEDGQMLYRSLAEIRQNIATFLVCDKDSQLVGACSLKSDWKPLVEVRSLVVHPTYGRQGIATALVEQCLEHALQGPHETLFVLTYAVSLFNKLGFQVVEKDSLPLKIWNDCQSCLHQENCDETAMSLSLKPLKISRLRNLPLHDTPEVLY